MDDLVPSKNIYLEVPKSDRISRVAAKENIKEPSKD